MKSVLAARAPLTRAALPRAARALGSRRAAAAPLERGARAMASGAEEGGSKTNSATAGSVATSKPVAAAKPPVEAPPPPPPLEQAELEAVEFGSDIREGYDSYWPDHAMERRSGLILHPTSLPGDYGIGEIGDEAFKFVDWLESTGSTIWQMLPLVPPEELYWSPYSSLDANAGNTLLISLESLVAEGLLLKDELPPAMPVVNCVFADIKAWKVPLLKKAANRLLNDAKFSKLRAELKAFEESHPWVESSALFDVLSRTEKLEGVDWWDWPVDLRDRKPEALAQVKADYSEELAVYNALQFFFDSQWTKLKAYANSKGIALLGDMPIYVSGHSADVWANSNLFALGEDKKPALVSGVPPDCFSKTGQLWGSPLYDWQAHKAEGYAWWTQRLARAFQLYDECRVDHFRAMAGYWSVEAWQDNAMVGTWKRGPGIELFKAVQEKLGKVPIVAEDLGIVTKDVVQLREAILAPGMVVLQFAWEGGPSNTHLPHHHYENSFCYPGTHDNETAVGWYRDTASPAAKKYLSEYTGVPLGPDGTGVHWVLIEASMRSVSRCSLALMQDVMGLDNEVGRINTPGKAEGNWAWRVGGKGIWKKLEPEATRLHDLSSRYGRSG